MPKKLKLERNNMELKIVNQKISELKEETEDKEDLGERFIRDKQRLEDLIAFVESSDLPPSEKKERLLTLRKTLEIMKEEYEKEVDEELEKLNEESEELIEMSAETIKESEEQEEKMQSFKMEASHTSLDESMQKSIAYREALESLKTQESEELKRRQEQLAMLRRHMERSKGR